MPSRRCVFIDFDGTLALGGVVPPAHVQALAEARRRGHVIILATGRPRSIVAPDVAGMVDGIIASAGAFVELDGRVVQDHRIPTDLGTRAIDVLEAHGTTYVLEAPEALWCTATAATRLRSRLGTPRVAEPGGAGRGALDMTDAVRVLENPREASFAKISVWDCPIPVPELAEQIGGGMTSVPNSIADDGTSSGELHLEHLDKADGLAVVTAALGFPQEATLAIGDGHNDIGMLRAAHRGVAIDGGPPEVLDAAQQSVPGPRELGVLTAFEDLLFR